MRDITQKQARDLYEALRELQRLRILCEASPMVALARLDPTDAWRKADDALAAVAK